MAKSRHHKKSKSTSRKTQHKMSQRGGGIFDWLYGPTDPKAAEAAKLKAEEEARLAEEAKLAAKKKAEEEAKAAKAAANPTTATNPADTSSNESFFAKLKFWKGGRGRKSSRRSNLKRKL
jgi:hypothetical protein